MILSPLLTVDALSRLETLIAKHNKLVVELYSIDAFSPKHHMLVHLVQQIRSFGPSRHHWAMRFEGKNALPKSKRFWNFKNISHSVAEYFQMKMSYDLWDGPEMPNLQHDITVHRCTGASVPFVLTKDFQSVGIEDCDIGKIATAVQAVVANVVLRVADIVAVGKPTEEPSFAVIDNIVLWKNQCFFLSRLLLRNGFHATTNTFMLSNTVHVLVLTPQSLLYPWPLWVYNINGMSHGIPKCLHTCPLE